MNDAQRIDRQQCPARPDDRRSSVVGLVGDAVEKAGDRFRLVINPVIYAEISIRYSRIEDLEAALPKTLLDREAMPYEAAFLAGKCFLAYRRRGGTPRAPLPDFLSEPTPRLPATGR
jgi:hypothetical protein